MVIADTGFWLALANAHDQWHRTACDALDSLQEPLITTWPVMTETCHLLYYRLGINPLIRYVSSFRDGAFIAYELTLAHAARITLLMKKYKDLPMDLADASLVILAEELGHGRILSTDQRDFKTYRWKQRKPFHNLLIM